MPATPTPDSVKCPWGVPVAPFPRGSQPFAGWKPAEGRSPAVLHAGKMSAIRDPVDAATGSGAAPVGSYQ